jgi:hypothetical protein
MAVNFNKISATNIIETDDLKFVTQADKDTIAGLGTVVTKDTGTAAGNIPVLDADGKLETGIIPALAISSIQVVDDIDARDALDNVQSGDIVKVTDNGDGNPSTYIYDGTDYIEIKTEGGDAVTSVAGKTGDVTLAIADIASLQDSLDLTAVGTKFSDELTISTDTITLAETAKGITSVYIKDQGYLVGGYTHNAGEDTIKLDDDSLDTEKAIVVYLV